MVNHRRLLTEMVVLPVVILGTGAVYTALARNGPPPRPGQFMLAAVIEGLGDVLIQARYTRRSKTAEAVTNIRKIFDSSVSYYEEEHAARTGAVIPKQSSPEAVEGKLLAANLGLLAGKDPADVRREVDLDLTILRHVGQEPLDADQIGALGAMIAANLMFHERSSPSAEGILLAFREALDRLQIVLPCP